MKISPMDVCRCCLTEACYKDMSNEYYHCGQKEVYSDMLLDTFNITISSGASHKKLICEECISKLRAATTFKHQILDAEEFLLDQLLSLTSKKENDIQEPKLEFDDNDFDEKTSFDDKFDDFDDAVVWNDDENIENEDKGQLFVIKMEPKKEPKQNSKKVSPKVKRRLDRTDTKIRTIGNTTRAIGKKNTGKVTAKPQKNGKSTKEKEKTSQSQIDMRENSLKLILNSNMCLFNSLKTRYACFFCDDPFLNISELREHSKMHSDTKSIAIRINSLRGMSCKNVEISNLTCKICSDTFTGLNELKTHLIAHDINFNSSNHLLIPYKLENGFKCVICDQEFKTFCRLSIHMNNHYKNNVCEICGVSYINRLSLRRHVNALHREKRCTYCPVTFISNYRKVQHMKKVHNKGFYRRHCVLCKKTFKYTYQLSEHKIEEHGAKRQVSECVECGKTFLSSYNLSIHMRSVHIRERNYPCVVCGMRFFTKCDQNRHERTHEDVRSFSCTHCDGRFKSKDSLRRHMKRQHSNV